jgi:NAD(P)-dependent dehydrogenase (short-subunit alcohol dehydrogenase family)
VILVTGAGSGIGRAAVIAMAQAGAKAIGCDLNPSTERDVTNVARFLDIEMMS